MKFLAIILTCFLSNSIESFTFTHRNQLSHAIRNRVPSYHDHVRFLDSKDILEDDIELLVQLRKQMENNLNASPREVTNRIKDFFGNNQRTAESTSVFKSYIVSNEDVLDVVNVILLVEGCYKAKMRVTDVANWKALLEGMEKPSALFTSSMIYRGISCLKSLNLNDPVGVKFIDLLWMRIEESGVKLAANDICPAIFSLQNLNIYNPTLRHIISYLAESMSLIDTDFAAKPLCSAIFGLRKQRSNIPEIKKLLNEISKKVENSESFMHSVNVCIALNGLQNMEDGSEETRRLMTALMDKAIEAHEQGFDRAGDREISMALFGLQKMGVKQYLIDRKKNIRKTKMEYKNKNLTPELTRVLKYVISLLNCLDGPFEAKRLGFAMMGLSNLSTNDADEVTELVQTIADKADGAWGSLSGQELSMIFHGLKSLQSDSPSVRSLLPKLTPLISRLKGQITPPDIRSALFGLQGMYSNHKEVMGLVDEIANLINQTNDPKANYQTQNTAMLLNANGESDSLENMIDQLSAQVEFEDAPEPSPAFSPTKEHSPTKTPVETAEKKIKTTIPFTAPIEFCHSLYGIQGLSSDHPTTRKLLQALLPSLESVPDDRIFDARGVGMCLYGLKSSYGDIPETLKILEILTPHVERVKNEFTSTDVATCLFGLQGFNTGTKEVDKLLKTLAPHFRSASGQFNPKGLSMALTGLRNFNSDSKTVRDIVRSVAVIARRTLEEPPAEGSRRFYGFDDFHQLSTALGGLNLLDSSVPEVDELLEVLSKVMLRHRRPGSGSEKLTYIPPVKRKRKLEVVGSEEDPEGVSRKWESPSTVVAESISGIRHARLNAESEIPKAEKVAEALQGLKRMDQTNQNVDSILISLSEFIAVMPDPDGLTLATAFEGFLNCKGATTPVQRDILYNFAKKMKGWSERKIQKTKMGYTSVKGLTDDEVCTAVQSILMGLKGFNRNDKGVEEFLESFGEGLLSSSFDLKKLDRPTIKTVYDVYFQKFKKVTKTEEKPTENPTELSVIELIENHTAKKLLKTLISLRSANMNKTNGNKNQNKISDKKPQNKKFTPKNKSNESNNKDEKKWTKGENNTLKMKLEKSAV